MNNIYTKYPYILRKTLICIYHKISEFIFYVFMQNMKLCSLNDLLDMIIFPFILDSIGVFYHLCHLKMFLHPFLISHNFWDFMRNILSWSGQTGKIFYEEFDTHHIKRNKKGFRFYILCALKSLSRLLKSVIVSSA